MNILNEDSNRKLLKYIYWVNTEEEKKVFVKGFRDAYRKLKKNEKFQVIDSLKIVLNEKE